MTQPLDKVLNFKLSAMMFLQYAIWGAWLPLLYPYLKNHMKFADGDICLLYTSPSPRDS